jgi:ABC-type lipoprotein export system ATPase subunit
MSNQAILRATDLRKTYQLGRVQLPVLRGLTLTIRAGEFVAIQGASGSGKSTLLHILGALDLPTSGHVFFEGDDIFACTNAARDQMRNATFGFIFQFYHLLPELNVLENIVISRMIGSSILGWAGQRGDARTLARELLERVGLSERIKHKPNELSGGERQRVAIARALVNRPRVLLADEPTGNLDQKTGRDILALLETLNDDGQTIVMVTHDAQVADVADRTLTLIDGVFEESPPHPSEALQRT